MTGSRPVYSFHRAREAGRAAAHPSPTSDFERPGVVAERILTRIAGPEPRPTMVRGAILQRAPAAPVRVTARIGLPAPRAALPNVGVKARPRGRNLFNRGSTVATRKQV